MSGSESPPGAGASAPFSARAFIHECNNLLAGILNATALLKRARSENDRREAIALIEDAVTRAQGHLQRLPRLVSSEAPAESGPAPANGKRIRVLVTEDDELNRQLLRKLLESTGRFDVTEAPNGSKAIESYRSERADLVILDLGLPDLGGAEVLERLSRIDTKAKILLLSGYLDARDPLTRAPQVVGFLQKPVEPPCSSPPSTAHWRRSACADALLTSPARAANWGRHDSRSRIHLPEKARTFGERRSAVQSCRAPRRRRKTSAQGRIPRGLRSAGGKG